MQAPIPAFLAASRAFPILILVSDCPYFSCQVSKNTKNLQLNYSTTIKADIMEWKDPCVDICAYEHTFFALITDQLFHNGTILI